MKQKGILKRIIALSMAFTMVFLSVDAGCITALAAEIQKWNNEQEITSNRATGYHSLEMITIDDMLEGEVYDYQELAEIQTFSEIYNNEWDKYSTNYYYNQLSDEWKKVWDALDVVCSDYLANEKDAFSEELEGIKYYCLDPITLPENTTDEDMMLFVELFMNSKPQYYFLNNTFLVNRDETGSYVTMFTLCLYSKFGSGVDRKAATFAFETEIETVLDAEKISIEASDDAKLKYVHDYIVKKVEYNQVIMEDDEITGEEDESAFSQSAYSVLCMDTTVCAGYAETLSLLCNGLGVDVATVTSANHMWNKVRIDDSWYNVDATWADYGENSPIMYDYYGRSDEVYDNDESEEYAYSHTELEMWENYLPPCTLDTAPESPYEEPGAFPEITETTPIPKIMVSESSSGNYRVIISPLIIDGSNPDYTIYYTTDGTTPSVASTKSTKYTGMFTVGNNYDIRAIAVRDGCYDSAVVRGVQVPTVSNVDVDDRFYNRAIISWESLGDKVDGYEIIVLNETTKEEIDSVLLDNTHSSYTVDTSNCEPGTKLQVHLCSYIGDENNMQRSGEYIVVGNTVKAAPLSDVELKWFVKQWRNTDCLAINLETGYQLYHYLESTGVNEYDSGFDIPLLDGKEHFYLFDPEFVPYDKAGYVIVCDADVTTAWQELGIFVGGEFKEPVLQPIADVSFSTTGQSATLQAIITNPMTNFDYRYQWYVSETAEGEATAIEGATDSTYIVTVDADETKYYFCRVTTEYGEITYVDTNNSTGGRTVVQGSMVGANVQISPIEDQTYKAIEITPEIEVKINDEILTKDTDYTVTYADNIEVGTATIVITFCGNYTGTKTATFNIVPANVENITVVDIPSHVYTGGKITPELMVTGINSESLEKGVDYVLTYGENQNVGQATVNITFIKNYSGTIHCAFNITPKTLNADNIWLENQIYTGSEILHKMTVMDGSYVLEEGVDYTVTYTEGTDNVNVGEVPLTVTFIKNYTGTVTTSFNITPKSAESLQITAEEKTYTGLRLGTKITVMDDAVKLEESVDYKIAAYKNNINVGTALVTLIFEGNYEGERIVEFKINPKSADENFVVSVEGEYTYTGEEIKPDVTVYNGNVRLLKGIDYTVSYSNNINVGERANVTVTYLGNYAGTSYKLFTIQPMVVEDFDVVDIPDQIFTGYMIIPDLIVMLEEKELEAGVDYDIEYAADEDNINVGENVTLTVALKGNYTGEKEVAFNIIPLDVETSSTISIQDIENQKYTGAEIMPQITVMNGEVELQEGIDFTVVYKNNKEVGKATVLVTFSGNYAGTLSKTFEIINPIPTSISSSVFTIAQVKNYISKITVGTTVQTLLSYLNESGYISIFDRNNNKLSNSTTLGTGMTACIMDGGSVKRRYTIIVTGDTNGDGKINITDMIAVKACTLKKSGLSGVYEKAGDVNGDGKINITDFIKVKATTLKKDTIVGVSVN